MNPADQQTESIKRYLWRLREKILDGRAAPVSATEAQWVLAAVALFAKDYAAK